MIYKAGNLPIIEFKNKENQALYAFGSLATLGFLKTVMDDVSLADAIPENFVQEIVNSDP